MEPVWHLAGKRLLFDGGVNLCKDRLLAVLVDEDYEPDAERHSVYADIKNEAVGRGYQTGGVPLQNQRREERLGEVHLHADDIHLPDATVRAAGVAIVHGKTKTILVSIPGAAPGESFEAGFDMMWGDEGVLWF